MKFRTAAAVGLGILIPVFAWTSSPSASAGAPSTGPFSQATPVNVVILADESGSMAQSQNAIAGEQQASIEIIQAAWSSKSQIAVYGFGSAPPTRGASPSQAVDKLCGLTELNTAGNLDNLTRCANEIKPRSQIEGYNTDFAAALTEAESVLSAPDPLRRVSLVFILTDGTLDLGNEAATVAAQQQISGTILPSLESAGIEAWPVGFGQADAGELSQFASGGAQVNPYCPADTGAAPKVAVVPPGVTGAPETQDIQQALLGAFAAASCGTISPGSWTTLPPGGSITVPVTIDPLTTLGSIVVNKGNPRVDVTYTDPDGGTVSGNTTNTQPAGFLDGAAFALTTGGAQSSQEALRLDSPVPGQWKVTFTNPSAVAQTVGVSVVWQGQVFPDVNFSPQVGDSGQPLQIQVRPAIHSAPVPASELSKLTLDLAVQWTQNGARQQVAARLDAATGEFVGTVLVPSGKGIATVTATVQERGVQGTAVAEVSYQPGGGMNVDLNIPRGIRVNPGGSLSETAIVDNVGQPPTSIEFVLGGLGEGVVASIAQPSHPVPIGSGRDQVPVTIRFGSQTRGEVLGTVQYEVTGSGALNTAAFLNVNVEPPPTTPWWVWTLIAIAAAALVGLLLFWWWHRRRGRRDVQHVGIALIRPGGPPRVPRLRWLGGFTQVRWFGVDRTGAAQTPKLIETTESGTGLLELRRDPADRKLTLTVHPAPARQETPRADQSPSGRSSAGPPRSRQAPSGQAEPVPEPMKPPVGEGFDPPPGTGLDRCQLILEELKPPKQYDEAHPPADNSNRVPGGKGNGRRRSRQDGKPLVVGKRKGTNGQQEGT